MSKAIKFAPRLKELRLHLCQTGDSSEGVREFIKKFYVGIKSNNPKFPILIRECSGVQPALWARYEKGEERRFTLENLSADDVFKQIETAGK